mgnify:CR=1 FL=1
MAQTRTVARKSYHRKVRTKTGGIKVKHVRPGRRKKRV